MPSEVEGEHKVENENEEEQDEDETQTIGAVSLRKQYASSQEQITSA